MTCCILNIPEKVNMTFKHAQAYLVFREKAADAASCAIHITNIKVKGARVSGTALIENTNYASANSDATTLKWISTGYKTDADTYVSVTDLQGQIDYTLTETMTQKGQLMVVPADMTTPDTYVDNGTTGLEISYTLDNKAYTYQYEMTNDTYEAGKKYIYDITFQLHEIFIQPTVEPWQEGNTTIVDIPTAIATSPAAAAEYSLSVQAMPYTMQIAGFDEGETVTATNTSESEYAIVPAITAAADANGIVTLTFALSDNTSVAPIVRVITVTGGTSGNSIALTFNQKNGFVYDEGLRERDFDLDSDEAVSRTFTVTGLPAGTYTVEEGSEGTDFITSIATSGLTVAKGGSIDVTVTTRAKGGEENGETRPVLFKIGEDTKFTVYVHQLFVSEE